METNNKPQQGYPGNIGTFAQPYANTPIPTPTPTSVAFSERDIYYKWRFETSIVAYVDLVLNGLAIICLIPCAIFLVYIAVYTDYLDYSSVQDKLGERWGPEVWTEFKVYIFMGTFFGLVSSSFELFFANRLRIATTAKRDPGQGYEHSKMWLIVNGVVLVFTLSSLYFGYDRWSVWFWLKLRAIRMVLVYMHMRECKQFAVLYEVRQKYDSQQQPKLSPA